jgi:hypothetical protein
MRTRLWCESQRKLVGRFGHGWVDNIEMDLFGRPKTIYSKRETAGSTTLLPKPEIEHNPERVL